MPRKPNAWQSFRIDTAQFTRMLHSGILAESVGLQHSALYDFPLEVNFFDQDLRKELAFTIDAHAVVSLYYLLE